MSDRTRLLVAFAAAALMAAGLAEAQAQSQASRASGWSEWKPSLVDVPDPVQGGSKWVHDTRLEYRWQAKTGDGGGCVVEVRPTGGAEARYALPELDVLYQSPEVASVAGATIGPRRAQVHYLGTLGVAVSGLAHASFELSDCGRVVTVGAGHFEPNAALPAF